MPGPVPKPAGARARTNKTPGARTLSAAPGGITAPPLPAGKSWHDFTRAWWADLWHSPMAPEYDASDRHGLFLLAELLDQFWVSEDPKDQRALASEIRLQRQCFGLTPIDRRRLAWEINRGEDAERRTKARRAAGDAPVSTDDPRLTLLG